MRCVNYERPQLICQKISNQPVVSAISLLKQALAPYHYWISSPRSSCLLENSPFANVRRTVTSIPAVDAYLALGFTLICDNSANAGKTWNFGRQIPFSNMAEGALKSGLYLARQSSPRNTPCQVLLSALEAPTRPRGTHTSKFTATSDD